VTLKVSAAPRTAFEDGARKIAEAFSDEKRESAESARKKEKL
jgi:hypothetical protein